MMASPGRSLRSRNSSPAQSTDSSVSSTSKLLNDKKNSIRNDPVNQRMRSVRQAYQKAMKRIQNNGINTPNIPERIHIDDVVSIKNPDLIINEHEASRQSYGKIDGKERNTQKVKKPAKMKILNNTRGVSGKAKINTLKNSHPNRLWVEDGYNKKVVSKNLHEPETSKSRSVEAKGSEDSADDLIVKREAFYVQMWINTKTKTSNGLTPKVLNQLSDVFEECTMSPKLKFIILSGLGSVFCSGIDLAYLAGGLDAVNQMVHALRRFLHSLILCDKIVVVILNGQACGLGVTMLPLCDIVYANDKATLHMPYMQLGQIPEACACFTFPRQMGMARANEMLYGVRSLTATEGQLAGLVSQVFWPTNITLELLKRLTTLSSYTSKVLSQTKIGVRQQHKVELLSQVDQECAELLETWTSDEFVRVVAAYCRDDLVLLPS